MASTEPGALKGLVDVERGIISREIFVSDEIYRQELERIFARAWLFIGHESQIPKPGDYLSSSMGEESVILCRDRAGRLRVFLNSCRHRGMKVCRYDERNTVEFQCPYHGWSYGTDGALVGVPFAKDAYGAQLDRSQSGLIEVALMAFLRNHDSPLAPAYQDAPIVADYFRHCEEERRRRRGEYWRLFGGPGTMFPNASPLARQPRTLAVWHPRGPHQTEVWRWYFVDADAPAEVKDFLRHYYIRYSGPSGLTEQDDMENWNYAHKASRGTIARQHPYNYEMGLGRSTRAFEDHGLKLPGAISDVTQANASEHNQRGFYTRWRQLMEAESWGEIATP